MLNTVFDRLDCWRHFPKYQLERHADVLFSLYLPEVIEGKLGIPMASTVIPEFPIRKNGTHAHTWNVDFVAFSEDGREVVFIELKTDMESIRPDQIHAMKGLKSKYAYVKDPSAAHDFWSIWLGEMKGVFRKGPRQRRMKYYCLFKCLEAASLIKNCRDLHKIMGRDNHRGVGKAFDSIKSNTEVKSIHIVYILPKVPPPPKHLLSVGDVVTFADVAKMVKRRTDPFSLRFLDSLKRWTTKPGNCKGCKQGP